MHDSLSWQNVLAEFAPLPSLLQKIALEERNSFGERAYELTRMLQDPSYQLMEQLLGDTTIVFSPPKVAGQTITATIWAQGSLPEPRHIHFLSKKGLAFMESLVERCRVPLNLRRWREFMAHSRWVRVLLTANRLLRTGGLASMVPKPVVIAGVREPMAQYLSLVFEHWWMYVDRPEDLSAESIRAQMLDDPWRHHCNNWFTDELGEVIGMDILARPFPTEQGWDVFETDLARVLIIRQENLDRLPEALSALYGIDPATITMESRNVAESKDYSSHYSTVKREWCPSKHDIEEVYSPPHVRHFYTPNEIAAFQDRWQSSRLSNDVNRVSKTAEMPHSDEKRRSPVAENSSEPSQSIPACEHIALPNTKPLKHPHHPSTCRPCPQCAQEIQLVPVLQKACRDRLEIIERMERVRARWPVRLLLKFRNLYQRILRGPGSRAVR